MRKSKSPLPLPLPRQIIPRQDFGPQNMLISHSGSPEQKPFFFFLLFCSHADNRLTGKQEITPAHQCNGITRPMPASARPPPRPGCA